MITDRLGIATPGEKYNDIRFNLMAVVPDKRLAISHKLNMLKTNRQIVLEALQQLVKLNHPDLQNVSPSQSYNLKDNNKNDIDNCNHKNTQKRKIKDDNIMDDNKHSISSIEEILDLELTNNKIAKKSDILLEENNTDASFNDGNVDCENKNLKTTEKLEVKEDNDNNVEKSNENSNKVNDSDINSDDCNKNNLTKISLIVTSEDNEIVKSEILDAVNTINKNANSSVIDNKSPDYSTPLTIQTSPAPSTSSTDTSSEVGSAFNSPTNLNWGWNSGQSSPNSISPAKDFKKFVVIRVAMAGSNDNCDKNDPNKSRNKDLLNVKKVCLEAGALPKGWEKPLPFCNINNTSKLTSSNLKISPLAIDSKIKCIDGSNVIIKTNEKSPTDRDSQQHTFAPKDLLALLKNLEGEISLCEGNLRDENEKRKKYKIDDCRRTHNYDEFICTFLSMLAQQGKLADLVQQHLFFQKKPGLQPSGQRNPPQRVHKKTESKITHTNKKSSKKSTKNRKRK